MANSEGLKSWLLDHSTDLNLRLTQFDWFHDWGLKNFCDLRVSIEVGGRTFVGRGTASSEDEALLKASGEALERAFTGGNHIHSTGTAVHTNEKMAQLKGQLELNERASFFGHFYSETPFVKLRETHWSDLKKQYPEAFEKLNSYKAEIGFFSTTNKNGLPTIICIASGLAASPAWGGIIGLSASAEMGQAIQSSFFECLRGFAAFKILGDTTTVSESEFSHIQKPTSFDRQKLARNVEYWKSISCLFPMLPGEIGLSSERELFPSFIQTISCPYQEIRTAPLYIYRAAPHLTSDLNSLSEKPDPITLNWLSDFFGKTITQSLVMRRAHFLG